MTVAYWVLASLLAALYLYSGGMKVLRTRDQLRPMMAWVDDLPFPLVRTIGVLEVLGAIGLIVPPLVGVAPGLALASAIGFVLLQIGAIAVHVRRGEVRSAVGFNGTLLVLAGVTAWLATAWV